MNLQAIVSRIGLAAVLCGLLSACAGEQSGGSVSSSAGPSSDDPVVLKISYFRAYPDGKTKQLECHFRCVISDSWKDRMGDSPRDPMARLAPKRVYTGYTPDVKMALYLSRLKEFGLDDLNPRPNPDDLKPEDYARRALNSQETTFTRVFTVGNEKGSKTYYYKDQQDRKDRIEKFVKCESYILRACEYAINVSSVTDPLPRAPK
jgi:hypothetical protein